MIDSVMKLGQKVPEFELATYDPVKGDFGKFSLAAQIANTRWTILFFYDENTGLALRGTFIINPEGTLLNSEVNFYNLGRNIDELMRKFKANVYMARKTNEVCPSKWKDEGDQTLVNPGAKMVGKVHEALQEPVGA